MPVTVSFERPEEMTGVSSAYDLGASSDGEVLLFQTPQGWSIQHLGARPHVTPLETPGDFRTPDVSADGRLVGTVNEGYLYSAIVKNPDIVHGPVEAIMQPALPFADISTSVDALASMLTPDSPAVLVRDFKLDATYIITRWDIIKALS